LALRPGWRDTRSAETGEVLGRLLRNGKALNSFEYASEDPLLDQLYEVESSESWRFSLETVQSSWMVVYKAEDSLLDKLGILSSSGFSR
jgi:hypothetical protein